MAVNPNQKFQRDVEKQRVEHQREMQMAWYAGETYPAQHAQDRGLLSRIFSFVTTLIVGFLGFSLLLGGIGFIVIGIIFGSDGALIGATIGIFVALLIALGASARAATA